MSKRKVIQGVKNNLPGEDYLAMLCASYMKHGVEDTKVVQRQDNKRATGNAGADDFASVPLTG